MFAFVINSIHHRKLRVGAELDTLAKTLADRSRPGGGSHRGQRWRGEAASVVHHLDCNLSWARRARVTFSKISEALAVQMNGLGCWL